MGKKLFVGSLSWDTTDASLRDLFSSIGSVVSAQVIMDKFSGKSRGFGFVEMETEEDAQRAVSELNGKDLDGRAIVVNEARERDPNGGGHGGFSRDNSSGGRRDYGSGGRGGDRSRGGSRY